MKRDSRKITFLLISHQATLVIEKHRFVHCDHNRVRKSKRSVFCYADKKIYDLSKIIIYIVFNVEPDLIKKLLLHNNYFNNIDFSIGTFDKVWIYEPTSIR